MAFQEGSNTNDEDKSLLKRMWSGITGSQIGKGFNKNAMTTEMAIAHYRNPFSPDAANYNPLLQGQKDFALRPTEMGGMGFTQDDIGRFLGSANPDDPDYNPLRGQNLISLFGTNDLQEMLRKRLAYFREKKYESETKTKKMAQIQEMINQAKTQDEATVKATPSLPAHYLEQGGGGYQDAPIHSAPKSHTAPSQTGYMGPGGIHYARGGIANLWQG